MPLKITANKKPPKFANLKLPKPSIGVAKAPKKIPTPRILKASKGMHK